MRVHKRWAATAVVVVTGSLAWGGHAAGAASRAPASDPAMLAALAQQDVDAGAPGVVVRIDDGRHRPVTAAKYPVLFAPGAGYSYSNTNYIALGLILERVTGDSVTHLLQNRILRPLGLRDTYLARDGRSRDGERLAHGYEPDAAHIAPLLETFGAPAGTRFHGPARPGHVNVTTTNPSYTWAAGAMVSTPRDWTRFLSALITGRLLPPAQLAEMRTTVEDPTSEGTVGYGLGLMRYTNPCGTVWGHTGRIPGFGSQNYTDASGRRTVSVVTITQFGAEFPAVQAADERLVDAAICGMLGRPIPAR